MRLALLPQLLLGGLALHVQQQGPARRDAYITMAHDEGSHGMNLLRTLPVLHALREVTNKEIILMTNETTFGDGTSVKEAFGKLNVQVWPINPVDVPDEFLTRRYKAKCKDKCGFTFFKLQAWRFTQFHKLIMFDTDAIVTRNFDDLFDFPGTWAQEERWWCQSTGFMSGGFVILEPNEQDYQGMMRWANTEDIPAADQSTISGYFGVNTGHSQLLGSILSGYSNATSLEHGKGQNVQLINKKHVDYGMCVDQSKNTPLSEAPPYVHKSDRNNHCFTVAPTALEPACRKSNLGRLYTRHLCEATEKLQIKFDMRRDFCQ